MAAPVDDRFGERTGDRNLCQHDGAGRGVAPSAASERVLQFEIDGGSPDFWGSHATGDVYEREIDGQGLAVTLRCSDIVFADNGGTVLVDIFCARASLCRKLAKVRTTENSDSS